MEFRIAKTTDADEVWEIVEQARRRLGALGIDQWQGKNPSRSAIEDDLRSGRGRAVTESDSIVGYCMIEPGGEPSYDEIAGAWLTDSPSFNPRYITVHRVAASDSAAGKGVGRFILESAEDEARSKGFDSVRVDTHEGNVVMQGLLGKCGYTRCGIVLLPENYDEPTRERIGYEKLV